jgi:hypothetical protein
MRHRILIPTTLNVAPASSTVSVFVAGTTNLLPDTLFADPTSGATLTNPYTHPGGPIVFYLAADKKVDVGVVPPSGSVSNKTTSVGSSAKAYTYSTQKVGGQAVQWVIN